LVDSVDTGDVMERDGVASASVVSRAVPGPAELLSQHFEHVAAAFALTSGYQHTLVYANAAFRTLVAPQGEPQIGRPITDAISVNERSGLGLVLDRAFRTGLVARNRRIGAVEDGVRPLACTVWPEAGRNGDTEQLLIELRVATQSELTLTLQREVAEQLLLSALRDQDATTLALESRHAAIFLATESRRLAESLDERETLAAMERMSLPQVGAWCIIDTLDEQGVMHRLACFHPDRAKQAILEMLDGRWVPHPDEEFGVAAALRTGTPTTLVDNVDVALAGSAQDPEVLRALRQIGIGPLLTVPLVIRDRLIGAVTFVGARPGRRFTSDDVSLAQDLADRSAMALDRARLYGEALSLRILAESANTAKTAFLGMMSHELRTPLNAIGGYVDLIDLEVHGPVTEAQRVDLARIRNNQRYLMGLINDLLNLTKVGGGQILYDVTDIAAQEILAATVALVEPLIVQKGLILYDITCAGAFTMRGDREKVIQILVNLFSNAIKFTPPGGRLYIDCDATETSVFLRVTDTGIGIAPEKLEAIFEPFVQVNHGRMGPEAGVGLGLAISRSLARAMDGELSAESALGDGARFTLTLPRTLVAVVAADAPN
jgi:signal transduction histidine kinase